MLRHLSFILFATMCLSAVPAIAGTTTLENLQAAYNGESNAHSRYLAFAKQASLEGYGEVASLFRAAARAEEIHASNHAAVLRMLGAVPQAT
jgi:rubrerythrin